MWVWLFATVTGMICGLIVTGILYSGKPIHDRADLAARVVLYAACAHVGVIVMLVTATVTHFVVKCW
jgi:hypothetical protein